MVDHNFENEEWRKVIGAPLEHWPYEISSYGRLRRTEWARSNPKMRILIPHPDKNGYWKYAMMADGVKWVQPAHRLVCRAWHGESPTPKHIVRHLDGDEGNNTPENLAWGTARDNMRDCAYNRPWGKIGPNLLDLEFIELLRKEYGAQKALSRAKGKQYVRRGWLQEKAISLGMNYYTLANILCLKKGLQKARKAATKAAPRVHED